MSQGGSAPLFRVRSTRSNPSTIQGTGFTRPPGPSSLDLDGFLTGMTVRPLFNRLYGPDLVNTWKGGPLFYDRIFTDAGVSPSKALVVDDSARAVEWASEAGAATVLVSTGPPDAAGRLP